MKKVAVLLTCFNRKEKTLKCLETLFCQKGLEDYELNVFLTDDNSPDGTGKAVSERYPAVNVSFGNGDLFWAGGMRNSWRKCIESGIDFEYYFLLNDDTYMVDNALIRMINSNRKQEIKGGNISIGTTIDKESEEITYGGFRLRNKYILNYHIVFNEEKEEYCELGCANLMLVSQAVFKKIGPLSEGYTHGIADFDYTLKAIENGFKVYVVPGILGYCDFDHGKNWKSQRDSLKERISYLYSPKGLAYKEYMNFIIKYFPLDVPSNFVKLWVKTLLPVVYDRFKENRVEVKMDN